MTNTAAPKSYNAFDIAWQEMTGQTVTARNRVWQSRNVQVLQGLVKAHGTTRYGRALRAAGGSL